jgi:hypothetical protein
LSASTLLYSQTYWGPPQKCTGLDQLLLARGPWEDEPILIRGIALTHRVSPSTEEAFAMAGSSAVDGDILGHVSGSGTAHIMYPPGTGFLFPARPATCHIDVHAWCGTGTQHEIWLTVFYQKPVDPLLQASAVPRPDNDRLAELARLHPGYRPVPPDPVPSPPPSLTTRVSEWWAFRLRPLIRRDRLQAK